MNIYTAAVTLILVMDPLGNIPIFLSILKKFEAKRQVIIILRESLIAFFVLAVFLFFGRYIMHGLHVTTSALSISGGIILFIIAMRMIFPPDNTQQDDQFEEPLIVPLAIPLTAGPSALAVVMLFVARNPTHLPILFAGVVIACVVFTIIMLLARYFMRFFGKRGLIAIERLMGMLLTTIAVQMFLAGGAAYFH